MAQEYKVESAMLSGQYDSDYGEPVSTTDGTPSDKKVMYKYSLKLAGRQVAVEMSQKPSTPPPKAGDVLYGDIETGNYGDKFKKASRLPGGSGAASRAQADSPEARRSIERQVALKEARQAMRDYYELGAAKTVKEADPLPSLPEAYISQIIMATAKFANMIAARDLLTAATDILSAPETEHEDIPVPDKAFEGGPDA